MKLGANRDQPRAGDRRGHRFFAVREKAAEPEEPLQVAHDIGARFELVSEKLDGAQEIAAQLEELTALIGGLRHPIAEEFRERQQEHAELQATRAAAETSRLRLDALEQAGRELSSRAAAAEAALVESEVRASAADALLRVRQGEVAELRAERSERRSQSNEIEAAHTSLLAVHGELEDAVAALGVRAELAEQRQREGEALGARLRQELLLLEQEFGVLRKRLEQANVENAQLNGRTAQLEDQLASERRRSADLEARLLTAASDGAKTTRLLESKLELQRSTQTSIEGKLEAALARVAKLDELNTGLTHRVAEAALRQKAIEDEKMELVVGRDRADANARAREQEAEILRREFGALEAARAAAVERADEMSRLAHNRETAAKRAERQLSALKDRLETEQADQDRKRLLLEERLAKVQALLDSERAERAIVEGALETSRRDRGAAAPRRTGEAATAGGSL
jgi:crescentin